jgi:PilZ domain
MEREPTGIPVMTDRIVLQEDKHYVVREEGSIELLLAGFKLMSDSHAAGKIVVIEINEKEVLRLPVAATVPNSDFPIDDRREAPRDRRTAKRRKTLKGAEIIWPTGLPVRCVVRNLSDDGASLEVHSPVPSTFDLIFDNDQTRHACQVVWRRETRVGVKFRKGS